MSVQAPDGLQIFFDKEMPFYVDGGAAGKGPGEEAEADPLVSLYLPGAGTEGVRMLRVRLLGSAVSTAAEAPALPASTEKEKESSGVRRPTSSGRLPDPDPFCCSASSARSAPPRAGRLPSPHRSHMHPHAPCPPLLHTPFPSQPKTGCRG